MFNTNDFKRYRHDLGFSSQQHFKEFLSAKDIKPCIDFAYVDSLNDMLCEIFKRINNIYYKPCNIESFLQNNLFHTFNLMRNNDILEKLNNQGRRKEEVYFSWMRGFLICEYFKEAMCDIFNTDISQILHIIESIGNKMWLEKKLNIKASNDYFDGKKEKYHQSKFLEAQDLAKYPKNDWLEEDIESRNKEIYNRLRGFFKENINIDFPIQ